MLAISYEGQKNVSECEYVSMSEYVCQIEKLTKRKIIVFFQEKKLIYCVIDFSLGSETTSL